MERLRIHTAGTGTLQYDSAQTETGKNPAVSQEFNYGTNFTVNTNTKEVHCYFNASRKAPEQFMAIYQSDHQIENNEKILIGCKRSIESTIDDLGWQLLNDNPGQEWFLSLDDQQTIQTEKDLEDIGKIASKPYEFKVGSPQEGVNFVRYLLSEKVEGHLAVGKENPLEVHNDLDIAVTVDESVDSVQPTGTTLQQIQEHELNQLRSRTIGSLDNLINVVKQSSRRESLANQIVRSLNTTGSRQIGIAFQHPKRNNRERLREVIKYILGAFGATLLLSIIGIIALGWTQTISELLFSSYTLEELGFQVLPLTDSGFVARIFDTPLPSIGIILLTAILLLLHLSSSISIYARRVASFLSPSSETVADQIQAQAGEVVSGIREINAHPLIEETEDLTKELNQNILYNKRIQIRSRALSEAQTELKKLRIVGSGIGILATVCLVLVGYLGADLLISQWEIILLILILASLLMAIVFIIKIMMFIGAAIVKFIGDIVSSRRRSRPTNTTSQKSSGPPHRKRSNKNQHPFGGESEQQSKSPPTRQPNTSRKSGVTTPDSDKSDWEPTNTGSEFMVRQGRNQRSKSTRLRRFLLLVGRFLLLVGLFLLLVVLTVIIL